MYKSNDLSISDKRQTATTFRTHTDHTANTCTTKWIIMQCVEITFK